MVTMFRKNDLVLVTDHYLSYYRHSGEVLRVVTLYCGEIVYEIGVDDGPNQLLAASQICNLHNHGELKDSGGAA